MTDTYLSQVAGIATVVARSSSPAAVEQAMTDLRTMAGLADAHRESIQNLYEPARTLAQAVTAAERAFNLGPRPDAEQFDALLRLLEAARDVASRLGRTPLRPNYGEGRMSDRDAMREAGR